MQKDSNLYKGIILAGGAGTRLHPITKVVSKQLLPIYDNPMIYYPLSTLINSGIGEILIITTEDDLGLFKRLLGNGDEWGVKIDFATQKKPEGIAQSLIIAEEWLNGSKSVLILGDNLFFGPDLPLIVQNAKSKNDGATLFCYEVIDPERFGVIEFDKDNNILAIDEKPKKPMSNWIITGLYIYDENASNVAKNLSKSERGEYEITDLNRYYLEQKNLKAVFLNKNYSWLDTGTHETLLEASNFVKDNNIKIK